MRNIVVTACSNFDTHRNRDYFSSLLTLISSVHLYSYDVCDKIYVYNLGLSNDKIEYLQKIKKVEVINFSDCCNTYYPEYLTPWYHGYKLFVLKDASKFGENILWLDSGICLCKDIQEIFNFIDRDHIFLIIFLKINLMVLL